MKKSIFGIFSSVVLLSLATIVSAQKLESPILITSAGQSADVKLVKLVAARQKLDATTVLQAGASDLNNIKTIVIVPGFSSKGLGAAGISQEEEMSRVKDLIQLANSKNIPIVLTHVGGSARRHGQSDAFNTLVAENSKHMIVVAQGDEDKFFSKIASEENIPIDIVDKIAETGEPLAKLFE